MTKINHTNFNTFVAEKKSNSSFVNLVSLKSSLKKASLSVLALAAFVALPTQNTLAQTSDCPSSFSLITPTPYGLDFTFPNFSSDIDPEFADFDGDGDLDMMIAEDDPDIYFLENVSTDPSNPLFAAPVLIYDFGTSFDGQLTVADLDGDGDTDMLLGTFDGRHYYFENFGTPTAFSFPAGSVVTNPFGLTDIGNESSPEFVDIDGDGDFDVFSSDGDFANAAIHYYENIGTPTAPNFAAPIASPFGLFAIFGTADEVRLGKVDIDNDGDFDFVYSNLDPFPDELGFIINTGTATAPFFEDLGSDLGLSASNDDTWNPTIVDIDGDGSYEVFLGNGDDYIEVFKDLGRPIISIAEAPIVSSCDPVTLSVNSSNYSVTSLNITWYDVRGDVVGTGATFTTPAPENNTLLYRAIAENQGGCSSEATNLVIVSCEVQGEVVINLSVTPGYNEAQLSWEVIGSRPVLEYEVYVSYDGGSPNILYGTTTSTTYLANGLLNGVNTSFNIVAVYEGGSRSIVSNTVTVRPSVVLGEDDISDEGFAFFPNPNSGEFNIKLQDGSTSAKITVTSLSGQQVYTSTLETTQKSITLGNVAAGMYIVSVKTEKGIYQQKVSVVH